MDPIKAEILCLIFFESTAKGLLLPNDQKLRIQLKYELHLGYLKVLVVYIDSADSKLLNSDPRKLLPLVTIKKLQANSGKPIKWIISFQQLLLKLLKIQKNCFIFRNLIQDFRSYPQGVTSQGLPTDKDLGLDQPIKITFQELFNYKLNF